MTSTRAVPASSTFGPTRSVIVQATIVLSTLGLWRSAPDTHATFKIGVICVGSILLLALSVLEVGQTRAFHVPRRRILWPTGALVFALFLATVTSDNRWRSLMGARGRGDGLVLYLTLTLLFLLVVALFDRVGVERLLLAVGASAVLVALYALLQAVGWDPWHLTAGSGYGAAASTLGNPNFVSGALAIALPLVFVAFMRAGDARGRVIVIATGTVIVLGIVVARSAQGFVAGSIGCALPVVGLIWRLPERRRARIGVGAAVLAGAATVAVVVGLLGSGPLSHQLSDAGRQQRVEFWRTGAAMVVDHPVVGVGLDGYGRFYRAYRSDTEALRRGVFDAADEPHNVPLGMFVGGGLILGFAYLAFVLGTGSVLILGIRASQGNDRFLLLGVGGAWLAYQVQSMISIDAPPLPLLHFLLAGAILVLAGQRRLVTMARPAAQRGRRRNNVGPVPLSPVLVGTVAVVTIVLLVLATRPAFAEMRAASALSAAKRGDGTAAIDAMTDAHHLVPREPAYSAEVGRLLTATDNPLEALPYYRAAAAADDRALTYLLTRARLADAAGHPDEARAAYRRARVVDRLAPELMVEEAQFELRHGAGQAALTLLQAAERARPGNGDQVLGLGDAYTLLGRPDDAQEKYDRALALLPTDIPLRQHLGEKALKAHDFDRAAKLFQEALDLDPTSGHLLYDLGSALEGRGDRAGALRAYTEATLHPPADPGLTAALERVGGP